MRKIEIEGGLEGGNMQSNKFFYWLRFFILRIFIASHTIAAMIDCILTAQAKESESSYNKLMQTHVSPPLAYVVALYM